MKNKCSVQKLLFLLMVGLFFLPVLAADIAAGTGSAGQDHDPAQTSLEVTYNLSGKLHDISNKELVITFSHDMVPLGGKRKGKNMVHIAPVVKGEFVWRGTKTLVFKPESRFAFATRYQVKLKKGVTSIGGKSLKQDITWEFTTPLPYPVKYRFSFMYDFMDFPNGSKRENVGTKNDLFFLFDQPVSIKDFEKKFLVAELTSKKRLKVECSYQRQWSRKVIKIKFITPLKNKTTYRLVLQKGLKGVEGNCSTDNDFVFKFSTPQALQYTGKKHLTIRQDQIPEIRLEFNHTIIDAPKEHISIFRTMKDRDELQPIHDFNIRTQWLYLVVEFTRQLNSGDQLVLRLKKGIKGIYGESLESDVHLTLTVCSPMPVFYLDPGSSDLDLYLRNTKHIDFTLVKFKDSLLEQLKKTTPSGIFKDNFKNEAVIDAKIEKKINLKSEGTEHFSIDLKKETGGEGGLYGVKINHMESYNQCQDKKIDDFIKDFPKELVFHKRDTDFVLRAGESNSLFGVYNHNTLQPVAHAKISIFREEKNIKTGKTGSNGLWLGDIRLKEGDLIAVEGPQSYNKIYYKINAKDLDYETDEEENTLVEIFSDRLLYKPGSTVYIGGIVKEIKKGKVQNPGVKEVTIFVEDPDGNEIKEDTVKLDEFGGFSFSFQTEKNSKKGEYWITVECKEEDYEYQVTVDYYQADAIKVDVGGLKNVYRKNDLLSALVSGYYLSGNPMSGDRLDYQLESLGYPYYSLYDDFPSLDKDLKDYVFFLDKSLMKTTEPLTAARRFDKKGEHRTQMDLGKLKKLNYLAELEFSVTGESAEGKEFSTSKPVGFFPGDRVIGINLPYFNTAGKPIQAKLAVIDNRGSLSNARADVTIFKNKFGYYWNDENMVKIKTFKNLSFKGKDHFQFTIEKPGFYLVKCDAIDDEGDVIASSASFYVNEINYKSRESKHFKIETLDNKEDYQVGEDIPLYITSPSFQKGKALITVEKDKILEVYVIDLEPATTTPLELPVKGNYFPMVKVNVVGLFTDGMQQDELTLYVFGPEKSLKVALQPESNQLEPSLESKLKVKIMDHQGKGKKARVFVYGVNEGNLQLTYDYRVPDLLGRFYFYHSESFIMDLNTIFSKTAFNSLQSLQFLLAHQMGTVVVGRVTNTNGAPLPGAVVRLEDSYYWQNYTRIIAQTVTNDKGFYLLAGLHQGSFTVTFEEEGYQTSKNNLSIAKDMYCCKLDVRLQEKKEEGDKQEEKETDLVTEMPQLDFKKGRRISGIVVLADGSPVPGVLVTLIWADSKTKKLTAITNKNGQFTFNYIPAGKYKLKFELEGFKTKIVQIRVRGSDITLNALLETTTLKEEITVSAKMEPIPDSKWGVQLSGHQMDSKEWSSLLRKDFQEVLFFQVIETDENGSAVITFKTSDLLSTYRLMAVAYTGDCFGSAETNILVSKPLYMEETMPEFARKDDRFTAGVQASNRTAAPLRVNVKALPEKISILDNKNKQVSIPEKGNRLVPFQFKANQVGESEIKFYAAAKSAKDGLLKKLPVTDCLVSESILDFDAGKNIIKRIQPIKDGIEPMLKLKVTPSLLKPIGKIAEKLIFYPYECMEQRTSKVMPYLILNDSMLAQLELKIEKTQVRESIKEYIEIIPEFMNEEGGMSYYRGGKYVSDYLTIYVLWALRLAEKKGFEIDTGVVQMLEDYLKKRKLADECDCFFHLVLSMNQQAEAKKLITLFEQREKLSVIARVFLYKAINNQLKDKEKLKQMLLEFNNGLQVEADFAYFDAKELTYNREFPFYSSRFVTALLFQAILEVEGDHMLAPRIINWLLDVPSYCWHTTQVNFWILYAMDEYVRQIEKQGVGSTTVKVLDDRVEKQFNSARDALKVEKNLEEQKEVFYVEVTADKRVYLTTEMVHKSKGTLSKTRGIKVIRNVYDETGKPAEKFVKGGIYQVELLMEFDKEVPYGVVDEPLAAGFEMLRKDFATTRKLKEFNTENKKVYSIPWWYRMEHFADRMVYYSYVYSGKIRFVYFVKALYIGKFTWLPTVVQGMYHPQYFGRTAARQITIVNQ